MRTEKKKLVIKNWITLDSRRFFFSFLFFFLLECYSSRKKQKVEENSRRLIPELVALDESWKVACPPRPNSQPPNCICPYPFNHVFLNSIFNVVVTHPREGGSPYLSSLSCFPPIKIPLTKIYFLD
jgi:hypothetical protein